MKIILFGAGEMTMKFLEGEDSLQYDIQAIADNDKSKHGAEICFGDRCFKIISADDILSYDYDVIIITIYKYAYQLDIMKQLMNIGVPDVKVKFWRNKQIINGVKVLDKIQLDRKKDVVLFDVTHITENDNKTGIQRVVKELYRNMLELDISAVPIRNVAGKWITGRIFDSNIRNKDFDDIEYEVDTEGYKVFLPDACWNIDGLSESLHGKAEVCVIIYDLIPIIHPVCVFDIHQKHFTEWMDRVIKYASKCVCISKSVADDLIEYYKKINPQRNHPLEVHYMHLGFDIPKLQEQVRTEISNFVNQGITFLIVGTVEIRKNHHLLLRSFKRVCQEFPNKQLNLLIIGKDGWKNEDFKEMYATDKFIQERCLWIKDASDSEVQWAYQHCAALVYPPRTEGFGLPLVEAAHFRLPILCSDIPIFREVVGDNADYFKVNNEDSLYEALVCWLRSDTHPDSGRIRMYSWRECTEEVVDILNDKVEPYAIIF